MSQESAKVITRFAPSPTGYFHAGSYRTALFAYIFARQKEGKFILRIEDTDKERSKKEYEENIIDSLKWLGLGYDDFYRQSDRTELYKGYIHKLIASGHAYVSKETPKEAGDRAEVIRFRNPNRKVTFIDMVRGPVEFDTTELKDFVVAKSIDEPIFHLVVVIDDIESGVTHVIRGEDHISNTPRQILIYEALGAVLPQYAHIPLLLAPDRSKLSKRNGAVPVSQYRSKGFLAEAVVNYLALLGWHPADDKEMFSVDELIKDFSLERVQKSGAVFDEEKLRWYNRQYILKLSDEAFTEHSLTFLPEWISVKSPAWKRILPVIKDKISTFGEITDLFGSAGELRFTNNAGEYAADMLLWKKNPSREAARTHIQATRDMLTKLGDIEFVADTIKATIWPYAEAKGRGDVLWPIRVALTGQDKSPDPFVSAAILGREECLKRFDTALSKLA